MLAGVHLNANTATRKGGGIYNLGGTITFSPLDKGKSMVIANKASGVKGSGGGGIYMNGGTLNLNSIKIQSNKPDQCVKTTSPVVTVTGGSCTA